MICLRGVTASRTFRPQGDVARARNECPVIERPVSCSIRTSALRHPGVRQRVGQRDQRHGPKRPSCEATSSGVATLDAALQIGWNVSQQFIARRQALADAIAQEDQTAARTRHDRAAAQQVRDKLAATLPNYRQSAESFTKLQNDGFVGELMANDKRRELIEREQDLKAQEATLQALDAAIAQSHSRMTQLRSQFRSQLLGERVEAEAAVTRLTQETAKAGFRSGLLEVRAPVAGTVQGLTTTTLGAAVPAGAPLLTVVPQGDVLRAEAVLANDDIGFVPVGQRAKVKLAAYPFQKYGRLEGKVISLSADAVEPNEAAKATGSAYAAPQLAYKAVIELDAQNLRLPNGEHLKLTPGMAATIEIHQGRRKVMEYLLSPVQRVTSEAGRER